MEHACARVRDTKTNTVQIYPSIFRLRTKHDPLLTLSSGSSFMNSGRTYACSLDRLDSKDVDLRLIAVDLPRVRKTRETSGCEGDGEAKPTVGLLVSLLYGSSLREPTLRLFCLALQSCRSCRSEPLLFFQERGIQELGDKCMEPDQLVLARELPLSPAEVQQKRRCLSTRQQRTQTRSRNTHCRLLIS